MNEYNNLNNLSKYKGSLYLSKSCFEGHGGNLCQLINSTGEFRVLAYLDNAMSMNLDEWVKKWVMSYGYDEAYYNSLIKE